MIILVIKLNCLLLLHEGITDKLYFASIMNMPTHVRFKSPYPVRNPMIGLFSEFVSGLFCLWSTGATADECPSWHNQWPWWDSNPSLIHWATAAPIMNMPTFAQIESYNWTMPLLQVILVVVILKDDSYLAWCFQSSWVYFMLLGVWSRSLGLILLRPTNIKADTTEKLF